MTRLKRAYLDGRLSTDTFESRVEFALATRYGETLRSVLIDLRRPSLWRGPRPQIHDTPPAALPRLTVMLSRCGSKRIVVGRSSDCDIVLASDAVSRQHAIVSSVRGRWYVTDLDSTNGTFVDDVRVGRSYLLAGAKLQLADTIIYIS